MVLFESVGWRGMLSPFELVLARLTRRDIFSDSDFDSMD
jgi:hypothetical protein